MTGLIIYLAGVGSALAYALAVAHRDARRRMHAAARRPIGNRYASVGHQVVDGRTVFDDGWEW